MTVAPDGRQRRGRTILVVAARMRSERLPGKVLADIGGVRALDLLLGRLQRVATADAVWVATSVDPQDDPVAEAAQAAGVAVFRGDPEDVLSRIVAVARQAEADAIVRVTADCPYADPAVIDRVIGRFHGGDEDYVSNTLQRCWPDGLDVEVFSRAALERTDQEADRPFLRQHVTPYMHGRLKDRLPWGGFTIAQVTAPFDFSHLRWTLDEPDDLAFFRRLTPRLPDGFGWLDVVAATTADPPLLSINRRHKLYEGTTRDLARASSKASGSNTPRRFDRSEALFARAEALIPLASQTFSKSYQQWVRGAAPLFIEQGHGCRVTDPDGNSYIDWLLGLLPIVLGYGDADVDAAIREQLDSGITFSLAHRLEAELAERLVRLIPCAEQVRFAKNGSDATSAAIRLARAHTGRDRVVACGYHGWHDWYIGTTTRDLGVPEAVKALSSKLPFNDADALQRLLAADPSGFAAIILEPDGVEAPASGYLEAVRQLADRYGVVLVFDEIVTGFRIDLGGAQAVHGVTPDLACFGKAMANGMPLAAVVGRRSLMTLMEQIFFSATFGGEALSLAAAVATLDKLAREDAVPRLHALGRRLTAIGNAALDRHGLGDVLAFGPPDWWPRLRPAPELPVATTLLQSLLRQEFVANGLLMTSGFNLCLAHDHPLVVRETEGALDRAFAAVRTALDDRDPASHLKGAPIEPVFQVR